jgi:DNA-binding HxlR family transcriptional regulator
MTEMRSYRQYCAAARALDVIGDRWNLLIVRELLLRGPSRYTDLQAGLPGIATNLLAERLRTLEGAGVLEREDAPPPVATTLFKLTPRGQELEGVLAELVRWGARLMVDGDRGDEVRSRWFTFPAELFLTDTEPDKPPVTIEIRTGDEPITIEAGSGEVHARPGPADDPSLVLTGNPQVVLGVIAGKLSLDDARSRGLQWDGDRSAFERLQHGATPVFA